MQFTYKLLHLFCDFQQLTSPKEPDIYQIQFLPSRNSSFVGELVCKQWFYYAPRCDKRTEITFDSGRIPREGSDFDNHSVGSSQDLISTDPAENPAGYTGGLKAT